MFRQRWDRSAPAQDESRPPTPARHRRHQPHRPPPRSRQATETQTVARHATTYQQTRHRRHYVLCTARARTNHDHQRRRATAATSPTAHHRDPDRRRRHRRSRSASALAAELIVAHGRPAHRPTESMAAPSSRFRAAAAFCRTVARVACSPRAAPRQPGRPRPWRRSSSSPTDAPLTGQPSPWPHRARAFAWRRRPCRGLSRVLRERPALAPVVPRRVPPRASPAAASLRSGFRGALREPVWRPYPWRRRPCRGLSRVLRERPALAPVVPRRVPPRASHKTAAGPLHRRAGASPTDRLSGVSCFPSQQMASHHLRGGRCQNRRRLFDEMRALADKTAAGPLHRRAGASPTDRLSGVSCFPSQQMASPDRRRCSYP